MRGRRIKLKADDGAAVYHCTSRTVNGEFLFKPEDRELLRRQIWRVADFCGVEVLTYTILSNHFHVLVRVPKSGSVSDAELLRRYSILYPNPTKHQTARLGTIKAALSAGHIEGQTWRSRMLRMMGDISGYLKLVKQRFSIAFNKRHKRYGTLWAERFKSVLLEEGSALRSVAAYIDLNCVRAGLAVDPKDYRFCGYAEAVAGKAHAQRGLEAVLGEGWACARASYRELLFGTGADPLTTKCRIPDEVASRVVQQHGILNPAEVLRCRLRFFTDGAVLGSRMYIEAMLEHTLPGLLQTTRPRTPHRIAATGPLSMLCAIRRVREPRGQRAH